MSKARLTHVSTACRTPNTCMLSVVPGPAAGIPHNMTPKKRVETKKGPNPLIVENGRPSGWDRISYRALNTKSVRVDLSGAVGKVLCCEAPKSNLMPAKKGRCHIRAARAVQLCPKSTLGGLGDPWMGSSRGLRAIPARHTHPGDTVAGWVGRW